MMTAKKTVPAPTLCYIPGREQSYSRNRVLLKAMKQAGLQIIDCSSAKRTVFRYLLVMLRFLRYKRSCDIVFVGFLGHFLIPIIKLCTRKKIMFDVFVSVYMTMVIDRKKFSANGIPAKLARCIDKWSCRLADVIFCDTEQHKEYFIREYGIDRDKFHILPVGSDDSVMYPRDTKTVSDNRFPVHFHGEFQPLHGARYIVRAAALVPDIDFQMIGTGKELSACKQLAHDLRLTNISFLAPTSYEMLAEHMAQASVCLGIFGDTPKTQMVIPHKVYEALAMGKPVVTADTPAVRELLTDGEHALLCSAADPEALADALRKLKDNPDLRKNIATNGHAVFRSTCTPEQLGLRIKSTAVKLLS